MKKINIVLFMLALCLFCQYELKGQNEWVHEKLGLTRDVKPTFKGWLNNPPSIKVYIDPSWSDADTAKIGRAMRKWNAAGGKPKLVKTASPPAEVTVGKLAAGAGWEGEHTPTNDPATGKQVSSEIKLKEAPTTPGLGLEELAAHEFGHALGLADTSPAANPTDVMKGNGANGTGGALSDHDKTELAQAAALAAKAGTDKKSAVSPTTAVQPGQNAVLKYVISEPVPSGSVISVLPIEDPFLQVTNSFMSANMLNVNIHSFPNHGSGTIYLDVHITRPNLSPINFIGIHYINLNPVAHITFQCPFVVTESEGMVQVQWVGMHSYPFTGPLRAMLVVDGFTEYETKPIGNYFISDLSPGLHTFALYVDDYQVNSASSTMDYTVIGSGGSGTMINAGVDSWTVPCGGISFGPNSDYPTIPAGFFGPGSEPFTGVIYLGGEPSGASQMGFTDTQVRRLESATLSGPGTSAIVPIELISLSLVSAQPIIVKINGEDSYFNVHVDANPNVPQPQGTMTITLENNLGGTFTSTLPVQPLFTFTKIGNPSEVHIFDPHGLGYSPVNYSTANPFPWSLCPVQGIWDLNGDGLLNLHTPGGSSLTEAPFLVRNDNFTVSMNDQGVPEMTSGTGYNNGTWYNYPNFNWWNVWFYDHPVATDRKKIISGNMTIMPRQQNLPSYVEIIYNWSTPQWPGWPQVNRPPLPEDVTDPAYENLVIERSQPLYTWQGNITALTTIPVPYNIDSYNPEWLSIDIRGFNFKLQGDIQHICWKPSTCSLINFYDFGDAIEPSYPTLSASNGAYHLLDGITFLGNMVDGEADGQPTAGADGDDMNGSPDEDGVNFTSSLVQGQVATVEVVASRYCMLNAWIDYDHATAWSAPIEQIFDDQLLLPGLNTLSFVVPATALTGNTYARFRVNSNGGIPYFGYGYEGEVEDHAVTILSAPVDQLDFGDAPDLPYPTLLASLGARHIYDPDVFLGFQIDTEPDGQPNAAATGDDIAGVDDEDGVTFVGPVAVGGTARIRVRASVAGSLNAWFDFNRNGSWADASDQIYTNRPLVAGINNLTFAVPAGIGSGVTYSRFRFNTVGGLSYTDLATDGEVEDYRRIIFPALWGYVITNTTHITAIPANFTFNCLSLAEGDFIGTFYTDGNGNLACGGAIMCEGSANQVLVTFGDDPMTPEKEGFSENEVLTWKVFNGQTGTQQIVNAGYDPSLPDNDGKFHSNGTSALTGIMNPLNFTATAVPEAICAGATVQLFASVTGGCGQNTFSWVSDPTGFTSNIQNPVVNPVVTTTYSVTVQSGFSTMTSSVTITVKPLPIVICPQSFSICYNAPAYTLTGATPTGGTYSGTAVSGGKFYPGQAGVGQHSITYTYTDPTTGCTNTCTFQITVKPLPTVNCPQNFSLCVNAPAYTLTGGTPAGGTYSGNGIATGKFYPGTAGVGVHTITYTYTDPSTGCSNSCTFQITVKPLPTVNCPQNFSLCVNAPAYTLTGGTPAGGTYSGIGVVAGKFYPGTAGVGVHTITYTYTDPSTGCSNSCTFQITVSPGRILSIPSGWNGISTNIQPTNPDVEVMFSPIINNLVILYNMSGIYMPSVPVNTLGTWNVYSGYVIKLVDLSYMDICGTEVQNKTVNLNQGWNLVPVLSNEDYNIETLFNDVPGFQVAKDVAGTGVYWKAYGINTIGCVEPGKAYYVRMAASGSINYTPSAPCTLLKSAINTTELKTPWNEIINTPGSHLVAFNIPENPFENGDIVGGFTLDGLCAGVVDITDNTLPFALSLNGDDTWSSENDGFENGEELNYQMYRPSTNQTFNLEVTYNPAMNGGYFENNDLSEVNSVKMSVLGYSEQIDSKVNIVPNPSHGIFRIEGSNTAAKVSILSALGSLISSHQVMLPAEFNLEDKQAGLYYIKIETETGTYSKKLIIQ